MFLFACTAGPSPAKWRVEPGLKAKECFFRGLVQKERGNLASAEVSFLKAISLSENFLEAHRHYQNVKIMNYRLGEVILEYRDWLEKKRNSPLFHYLYGRVIQDLREKTEAFSTAVTLDPAFYWGHFGLAYIAERERRLGDALFKYQEAIEAAPERAEPYMRAGLILWRMEQKAQAEKYFLEALTKSERNGNGKHLAQTARFYGHEGEGGRAMEYALLALADSPHDPLVGNSLRELLKKYGSRDHFWRTLEILGEKGRESGAGKGSQRFSDLRGFAYKNLGHPLRAASIYEAAYASGNRSPELIRSLRSLYVALARYEDALKIWKSTVPVKRILSPANLLKTRYHTLFMATERAAGNPDNKKALLSLAEAYRGVGWLAEAGEVYGRIRLLDPEDESALRKIRRLEQCEDLIRNLQAYFEENYSRYRSGMGGNSLERTLIDLYDIAKKATGFDFKREPSPVRHYPFLGTMTLPWGEEGGALEAFLNSFNTYLIVGNRSGGRPEAFLIKGLVREVDLSRKVWEKEIGFDLFLGGELLISGFQDYCGGQAAGVAFEDTIFIFLESLKNWMDEAKRIQKITGSDGEVLLSDFPLPVRSAEEFTSLGNPLFLKEKLLYRHHFPRAHKKEEAAAWEWEGTPLLDMILWHEIGHIVDVRRYIPFERNFFRNLWLATSHGFSSQAIEAELEGRAQLTSLAYSSNPYLALAGLIDFLPDSDSYPPHSRGYYRIAEKIVSYIQEHLEQFPAIGKAYPIVQQLHGLTGEEIKAIAQAVGRELGL